MMWWTQAAKRSDPSEKQPDICDLCGAGISEDDHYFVGFTHYSEKLQIWAFTCSSHKCTDWLLSKEEKIKTK